MARLHAPRLKTTEVFRPNHGSRSTKGDTFRKSRNQGAKRHQGTPTVKFGPAGKRVNPQAF